MMGGMFEASTGEGLEVLLNRAGTTCFGQCVRLWLEWCCHLFPFELNPSKGKRWCMWLPLDEKGMQGGWNDKVYRCLLALICVTGEHWQMSAECTVSWKQPRVCFHDILVERPMAATCLCHFFHWWFDEQMIIKQWIPSCRQKSNNWKEHTIFKGHPPW